MIARRRRRTTSRRALPPSGTGADHFGSAFSRTGRSTRKVSALARSHFFASVSNAPVVHAGKAIALAAGIGLGAAGAGPGIGFIFGSMIQSVARQPELRGELQGLMWLGFALTEAVVFYGFLGGLLGYVLV